MSVKGGAKCWNKTCGFIHSNRVFWNKIKNSMHWREKVGVFYPPLMHACMSIMNIKQITKHVETNTQLYPKTLYY
jgi:hypothetical protein